MRLLLDTHVVLWWTEERDDLHPDAQEAIRHANLAYVSLASVWEVAIKVGLRRLKLPAPFEAGIRASGFTPLPITFAHTEAVATLPHHHRDPFDRMLIAQARVDGLTVVTRDRHFSAYGIPIIWA